MHHFRKLDLVHWLDWLTSGHGQPTGAFVSIIRHPPSTSEDSLEDQGRDRVPVRIPLLVEIRLAYHRDVGVHVRKKYLEVLHALCIGRHEIRRYSHGASRVLD